MRTPLSARACDRRRRAPIWLLLFTLATACDEAPPTTPFTEVGTMTVEPATVDLPQGERLTLRITVVGATGVPVPDPPLRFWTSDERVASVSSTGTILARQSGVAVIGVSSGGSHVDVVVSVHQVVRTLELWMNRYLRVGWSQLMGVQARDRHGQPMSAAVTVRSSDTGVATVSPTPADWPSPHTLLGLAEGEATIVAEAGAVTTEATLTVLPAWLKVDPPQSTIYVGQATRLAASVRDELGRPITPEALSRLGIVVAVQWMSDDETVATVDSDGVVRGVRPGAVRIYGGPLGSQGPYFTVGASARVTVQ